MEGDRKLQYILMGAATVIFGFSYMVGYFVGKEAGFEEAKKKFDIEKQKLLKTIAALSPVSQPRVENKIFVVDKTKEVKKKEEKPIVVKQKEKPESIKSKEEGRSPKIEKSTKEKPFVTLLNKGDSDSKGENIQPEKFPKQVKVEEKTLKENSKDQKVAKEQKTKGNFYLQVGVFKNKGNAQKLTKKLKAKGFNAEVLDKGRYAIVIVGYFGTKEEAMKTKKSIKETLKLDSIVRRRK
ncbi:MAG: SPOR domain-containing protein [Desulfurobacteriaceae bacterium]